MKRFLLNTCSYITVIFLSVACTSDYSKAKEMGQKWCNCNEKMGRLFKELNATDNQQNKDEIAVSILTEQAVVLKCMGGEDKLKLLNEKFSGTNFQNYYDKARLYSCPELVKLLSKK
jgi:hypothetical protein